jgi:DTW domain-containing protein YfiP
MSGLMSKRARCERCLRPQTHCLCALIPHLDSRTRVHRPTGHLGTA